MKRLFKWSALIGVLGLLAGCPLMPVKPEPTIQYRNVLITPADYLLDDCEVQTPPEMDLYLASENWTDKEALLVITINEAMAKAAKCNIRWRNLRQWKVQQIQLLQSPESSASQPK